MVIKFGANICRICSNKVSPSSSINLTEFSIEFQYVTFLEFSEDDNLPKSICPKCLIFLKIATFVKRTAFLSEEKFNIVIQNARQNFRKENLVHSVFISKDMDELTALLPLAERQAIANINLLTEEYIRKKQIKDITLTKTTKNQIAMPKPVTKEHAHEGIMTCDKESHISHNLLILHKSSFKYSTAKSNNTASIANNINRQIRIFKPEWIQKFQPWLLEKNNKAYCSLCGVYLSNIVSHIYRHKNTLKHIQNSKLAMNHTIVGQPLKEFKCRLCKRSYNTKIKLLAHLRLHENGESNVKCAVCLKKFRLCT